MTKKPHQSKTIIFNILMAGVEAAHGSIHLLAPVLTDGQFAAVTIVVGMIHGMGGVYLRFITREPIK